MFLSKSALNTYGHPDNPLASPYACPYKFKLHYIEKIVVPEKYSPALDRGKKFHDFAERFFNCIEIKNDKIQLKPMINLDGIPNADKSMYTNFIGFENKRYQSIKAAGYPEDYFYPLHKELEISNAELEMKGFIDRIDMHTDDGIIAVEYKTDRTFRQDQSLIDELAFYKILWDKLHPDKPVKYFAAYFPSVDQSFFVAAQENDVKHIQTRIEKTKARILEQYYPKRGDSSCKYCEYYGAHCDGKKDV